MVPSHATNLEVSWSVQDQTGKASISSTGLLTALADGVVAVKAASISNPSIEGSLLITITNQPAESKVGLMTALDLANENINSVVVSVDGEDVLPANQWVTLTVMDTFSEAKITAQIVYDEINSNQTAVNDVVSELNAATISFDAAKTSGSMIIALLPLNTAKNYAVLAKSGITSSGVSTIIGDMGVNPGNASSVTGFSLNQDPSGYYSKSDQVEGSIFTASHESPTPTLLNQAILDMENAYDIGQGLASTGFLNLYDGHLSGKNLTSGIYSWSTGVSINTDLTITGSAHDVWIFQISESLFQANNVNVILSGGALAEHIFWLVNGEVFVGAESTIQGNILANNSIELATNATIHGSLYSQNAVTFLNTNVIANVIKPSEIHIKTSGDIFEINEAGGTLAMLVEVMPNNTSNAWVNWSVINQTGTATIHSDGLLTAGSDGTVVVRATSINYPSIFGETTITLFNQVAYSKTSLMEAVFNANTNYDGVVASDHSENIPRDQVWVTSLVLATYRNAIDAAQSIIDLQSATQPQVNGAVTTLSDATNSFNEEKAFGTYEEPLSQSVNLGTAADFAILAKSAITTSGATAINGDIGVSPVAASYLTGFGLVTDPSNEFSTSTFVNGQIYAGDYAEPTPTYLSTAISDMENAHSTAMSYTPDGADLHSGDLSGKTLNGGVYQWGTDVIINSDFTISGNETDTWIFQISGKLTFAADVSILLNGGALASNIFWIVEETVTVGASSHLAGNFFTQVITMGAGSSVTGRLFSYSAITLASTIVTKPS